MTSLTSSDDARPSSRPTWPTSRARIDACLPAGRPRPGGGHAGRGDQDLAGRGRTPARRARASPTSRENRDQEAADEGEPAPATSRLTWHFVGQVQTNKAASVARYADVVHVRRPAPARRRPRPRRARRRGAASRPRPGQPRRRRRAAGAGRGRRTYPLVADAVAASRRPRPARRDGRGPAGGRPGRRVRAPRRGARGVCWGPPAATWLSAGMSGTLEAAIRTGATHVRDRHGAARATPCARVTSSTVGPPGPHASGSKGERVTMAGAMRKMGVYLGLVEDEADATTTTTTSVHGDVQPDPRPDARPTRTLTPVRDEKAYAAPRTAAPVAAATRPRTTRARRSSTPTGSRRCTRATTTTPGRSASTTATARR